MNFPLLISRPEHVSRARWLLTHSPVIAILDLIRIDGMRAGTAQTVLTEIGFSLVQQPLADG